MRFVALIFDFKSVFYFLGLFLTTLFSKFYVVKQKIQEEIRVFFSKINKASFKIKDFNEVCSA